MPIVNTPLLHYQFEILRRHGIREVVLCTAYQPEAFRRAFKNDRHMGLKLNFVHENAPLGTGGAVRNAERYFTETTLILNGDLLNALDVTEFFKSHRKNKADVSISLTRVKDPTLYGLVETDEKNRIRRFLEKPSWNDVTCNTINAGAYFFEPAILQFIPPGVPFSLERGLFPQLLQNNYRLNGFLTKGYWIDVGTVDKYLQVHLDILGGQTPFRLSGFSRKGDMYLAPGAKLGADWDHESSGKVALGAGTKAGPYARFIGSVSVGPGCSIGQGAVLENCVVLGHTRIGEGARLDRCVVGNRCQIGPQSTISSGRALGDGSIIQQFSQL